MNIKLLAVLTLTALTSSASAVTMAVSPALESLKAEYEKDPASLPSREQAKAAAGSGYTGERDGGELPAVSGPAGEQETPAAAKGQEKGSAYTMPGVTPLKGLTIHTPKLDPTGDGHNTTEGPQSPIKDWMVYGALGIGAVATIAGFFFPPLLFLGGLGLGIGGLLWYIKKKLG